MLKKDFDVSIVVNGSPIKEYHKDGLTYVEAKEGSHYSIKVKNNSSRRIVAIITVDGLSIIDGEPGSYDSLGYIVGGYNSIVIDGWRKDENNVAKFVFSTPEKSYSKQIKNGKNVGVIGCAIMYEQEPVYNNTVWFSYDTLKLNPTVNRIVSTDDFKCGDNYSAYYSSSNCSLSTSSYCQSVGTGWGENKKSGITEIPFKRDDSSVTDFIFYYNSRSELEKLGIDFKEEKMIEHPSAFPNENKRRFCKEPN